MRETQPALFPAGIARLLARTRISIAFSWRYCTLHIVVEYSDRDLSIVKLYIINYVGVARMYRSQSNFTFRSIMEND